MNINNTTTEYVDVLIIGSGAAGLGLALSLADNTQIAILSKSALLSGSSHHAQGGIAAVMNQQTDSYAAHIHDTLQAGAGLCRRDVVEFTVKNAKPAIEWLISQGVQFTTEDNYSQRFHLNQEGGHSHRRILHAEDQTGSVVVNTLAQQINQHPHITCFTEHTAIDLLTTTRGCVGVIALNNKTNQLIQIQAKITVLATGGASTAYLHTSNPDINSGDGIAMAWRAGCRVANLEFNQFHPTCFFHPKVKSFLISEAVRGEGGKLIIADGKQFMPFYDPRAELAPRDIVARAIDHEMKKNNLAHVYLDITHLSKKHLFKLFPTIYAFCKNFGVDMAVDPIPVVPAAHYTCGGVMTNIQGQTDIANLYAIGEVACTGMHGANRMASNSLLECLVFAMSASKTIQQQLTSQLHFSTQLPANQSRFIDLTITEIKTLTDQLRTVMWNKVGIVRNNQRLRIAAKSMQTLQNKIKYATSSKIRYHKSSIELKNLFTVCELIVNCASLRQESRGLHYNIDYPKIHKHAYDTILTPSNYIIK